MKPQFELHWFYAFVSFLLSFALIRYVSAPNYLVSFKKRSGFGFKYNTNTLFECSFSSGHLYYATCIIP